MKAIYILSPSGVIHFVTADSLHHAINKVQQIDEYKHKTYDYKRIKPTRTRSTMR